MNPTDRSPLIPGGLAVIGEYTNFRRANDHGLVILSMGLAYWMYHGDQRYFLCIESPHEDEVKNQISLYDRDHRLWPSRRQTSPGERGNAGPLAFYGLILIAFHVISLRSPDRFVALGGNQPVALLDDGHWWRPVTALTLHADATHLFANLISGCFFGYFVNRSLGVGLGWFLILIGGIVGNALSAAIFYPANRISIGASTAVFGAVGILAGSTLLNEFRLKKYGALQRGLIPLAGGLSLLALLGTGDLTTNVVAHLCGFLAGVPLGMTGALLRKRLAVQSWIQSFVLLATLLILATAWNAAVH